MTLEQVLADWRGDAQVLRKRGHVHDAELIERLSDDVATAAEDYLRFVTEPDAMMRSGRGQAWLRRQFSEWERMGHARRDGRRRLYRVCVVPQRANVIAAREAGRQAAGAGVRA